MNVNDQCNTGLKAVVFLLATISIAVFCTGHEQGEQCEPPNGTTCDESCQRIEPAECGNRIVEEGEECEPPNGTTCDESCQRIKPAVCGNGIVEEGEQCEPPDTTTCNESCQGIEPEPELELAYIDQFEPAWSESGGTCWRPIVPSGFYALGHYDEGDLSDPSPKFMFAARELTPGALAPPVYYMQVWPDEGSGAYSNGILWRPIPPAGYVCLGLVGQTGNSTPRTDEIMCVRQDLVAPGKTGKTIRIDESIQFGSWHIIPADNNGIYIGTFTDSSPPTYPVFVLDASSVRTYELDSGEIDSLVQTQGPVLYLHSDERYFLDDPEYVLDRMQLVWGLVQNEKDYDSFSFQSLGSVNTSSANLMGDVENYVESDPDFGDPSFRHYLHIDDYLKPGNLSRAKVFVRVRPIAVLTEVQFWFFYPFNGPGRVRICLSGNICDDYNLTENGRHYGDWEHVDLRFINSTGELVSVYMSAHSGGHWVTRKDFGSVLQFVDGHPVIYSAKYSHAHYPSAGRHYYERIGVFDYVVGTFSLDLYDLTNAAYVYEAFLPGNYWIFSSELPGYPVAEPDWLSFTGRWGQYERVKDWVGPYGINVYPYEEVQRGPTGPAMKEEW
ncbi:MAG: Vps62-related protein [Planctomycetota bacterium]